MAKDRLDVLADDPQRPHVEGDVQEIQMQEHDRDHAPVLVPDEHVVGDQCSHALELRGTAGAGQRQASRPGGNLDQKDDDVDGDQSLGR